MRSNVLQAEKLLKMLANENRLMILCHLMNGELTVSDLNDRIDISQSALSQHLAKMREDGMVATSKQGLHVFYRISNQEVGLVLQVLHRIFCK